MNRDNPGLPPHPDTSRWNFVEYLVDRGYRVQVYRLKDGSIMAEAINGTMLGGDSATMRGAVDALAELVNLLDGPNET